jgi:hypothetical protein
MEKGVMDKINLLRNAGKVEKAADFLSSLFENGRVHPLITLADLQNICREDLILKEVVDAILKISNIDPNYPTYREEDFIKIYEYYTGVDGKRRLPLPKYLPAPIFSHLEKMQKAYCEFLNTEYDKSLPKRPGLIVMSGYRSPYYQVFILLRNIHELGTERAFAVTSIPGSSQHASFDNCAIDFTSMGDENGIFCDFEKTVEFRWLLKNCHKYNFWIPYFPDEKGVANSTRKDGMAVEAWHYEYRTDAEDLMNQNKVVDLFQKRLGL